MNKKIIRQDTFISGFIYSINHTPPIITSPPIKRVLSIVQKRRLQKAICRTSQSSSSECADKTFQNHFICRLFALRIDWPLQLWNAVTEQTLITLNLLQTSRIDRTKSAYHQKSWVTNMIGMHIRYEERNSTIVYENPEQCISWGTRGGPIPNCTYLLHSCYEKLWNVRIIQSLPQHFLLPQFIPDQHAEEVYNVQCKLFDQSQPRRSCSENEKALDILATETPIQRVEHQCRLQRVNQCLFLRVIHNKTSWTTLLLQ